MRQTLEYYYGIYPDNLCLVGDSYKFIYKGEEYYFVYYTRSEKELFDIVDCSSQLKQKNINSHDIILNNMNQIVSKVEAASYILLRVINPKNEYSIIEMMDQNKKTKLSPLKSNLYRDDWSNLWAVKVDFIEKQLNEININKIILKTIDYYIGLAENAICYINKTKEKYSLSSQDNIVLSHKRIYYPNYSINYCNPLGYIFDLEIRDVAEYCKSMFFSGEDPFLELQTFLKCVNLTNYSYHLLFARLLYPSYYFDVYEKVINNKESDEKVVSIVEKVEDYELFLKKAYKEISLYANIEPINWLIK